MAHYAHGYLRRHQLPEQVSVTARYDISRRPARAGRVELDVQAPGLPERLHASFRAVIEHCTVHNSLVQAPEIVFDVSSGDGRRAAGLKHCAVQITVEKDDRDERTLARAVLAMPGGRRHESTAIARRNPADRPMPEIGDELATGRALMDLADKLIGDAADDVARFCGPVETR